MTQVPHLYMRKTILSSFAVAGLVLATASYGADDYNVFPGGSPIQHCYGLAMVGMDSVINSRIGVPAEHALELARTGYTRKAGADDGTLYSTDLLSDILNAYLWDESPHTYALTVFYRCAQRNVMYKQASSNGLLIGDTPP